MLVLRDKLEAYLPIESRLLRVGKKTSAFLSTLDQRLFSDPEMNCDSGSNIYPAMFEITRCDSRTAIGQIRRLGRPQKMTCLNWKSDARATVIHPLLKGTGYPPERHRRGKI
jgi:hypothetical protein